MNDPQFDRTDIAEKNGDENSGACLIAALYSVVLFEHLGICDTDLGDQPALAAADAFWPAIEPRE